MDRADSGLRRVAARRLGIGRVLGLGGPKRSAVLAPIQLPNPAVCWVTMSKTHAGRDLG